MHSCSVSGLVVRGGVSGTDPKTDYVAYVDSQDRSSSGTELFLSQLLFGHSLSVVVLWVFSSLVPAVCVSCLTDLHSNVSFREMSYQPILCG